MRTTIIALVASVLAACGSGDSGATSDTTDPSTDAEGLVLEITSEGGFMLAGASLDTTPRYALTADRSLYHQGPIPEIFPGPLLPNIQVTTLSESDFEEVMSLIQEIGFPEFEERVNDDAADRVADAATDVFRYYDQAGEHRYAVYALGLVENREPDLVLLNEIVQILDEATVDGGSEPYRGDRLQVIAGPPIDMMEPQMTTQADWPLDTAFADMEPFAMDQRCTVVDGTAAGAAYDVLAQANQGYRWGSEGLAIHARPLLPGEEGCEVPQHLQETSPPATGEG